ncbi:hypothetical protein SAMN05216466_112234 [Paraburkholderia phenazinium]|uniref:Uncharacterized protein n=1 Tax=Paraburkholderia phenazinium TaxID=60549 RepID=A0A1G8ETY8_9BURK|nr:hypothetical protein [Paraburkholderia phenazinium]SDH73371.1 hypothetical protein SAMN05216466_112234 [Paraburkholderia phenazinium]
MKLVEMNRNAGGAVIWMTGSFDAPVDPDLSIETDRLSVDEGVGQLIAYLAATGVVPGTLPDVSQESGSRWEPRARFGR